MVAIDFVAQLNWTNDARQNDRAKSRGCITSHNLLNLIRFSRDINPHDINVSTSLAASAVSYTFVAMTSPVEPRIKSRMVK